MKVYCCVCPPLQIEINHPGRCGVDKNELDRAKNKYDDGQLHVIEMSGSDVWGDDSPRRASLQGPSYRTGAVGTSKQHAPPSVFTHLQERHFTETKAQPQCAPPSSPSTINTTNGPPAIRRTSLIETRR
mmetsp:Transcript_18828/g.35010  ORF Transcript_18828/g.35010 Transcript_18828/m.35010 type:complete len:129 (+) Transcript_18828:571-957(+)